MRGGSLSWPSLIVLIFFFFLYSLCSRFLPLPFLQFFYAWFSFIPAIMVLPLLLSFNPILHALFSFLSFPSNSSMHGFPVFRSSLLPILPSITSSIYTGLGMSRLGLDVSVYFSASCLRSLFLTGPQHRRSSSVYWRAVCSAPRFRTTFVS